MDSIVASDSDVAPLLTAKTCGSSCNNAKVVYSFVEDTNQMLFVDKRNIIINNQLDACQRLLPYISKSDWALVERKF
jgi:hypothetical protein